MIIGIDTSTTFLSLAIKQVNGQLHSYHEMQSKRHGETLLPQLAVLMKEAKVTNQMIKGIAVGLGPGSFTGVRIGVATALGLAQTLACPIVGLSSYAVIAANQPGSDTLVIGDARRGKVYAAGYKWQTAGFQPFINERLTDLDTLLKQLSSEPLMLSGPDASIFHKQLQASRQNIDLADEQNFYPKADTLITLAEALLNKGGMAIHDIKPLYLRKTQAEEMVAQ